ncbi:MAG: hypothetical protein JO261_13200 [Alphaproteobacteria bacterium]|nr:hypothetical protein [Alphaproteobacteria bacterium]MBV9694648.1 hypothetical protein [Alphaproteobacteria bacterium]
MIANKVKLVVWDLDDTFWQGTLAEGGITPVADNVARVVELSKRGIVNSICSKNDHATARAKLEELGAWDYFVFPVIRFEPKGKAIAEMIETAALRAENVLFLDDNPANLEEARYFNPGIMAAHPSDVLEGLLDHPHLAGKPDPELTRLNQYRFLQKKAEVRSTSTVSNEEFLRQSDIRVTIDYDVEANFDRVVELINRANQLNYTKKRLEKPAQLARFRESLRAFALHSGCVWVRDNYGDYGLVGFFQMARRPNKKKLRHFVFSCRTMNMGIEQYIYDLLDRPEIDIVEPVSYGLEGRTRIDWINRGEGQGEDGAANGGKLLLLGGCDLLRLSSYCSTNRLEFVNKVKSGLNVRYDDFGFLLSDREALRNCAALLPTWTYEDALEFDEGVATSDLILLCMFGAINGEYYALDGVQLRLPEEALDVEIGGVALRERVRRLEMEPEECTRLILKGFDRVHRLARDEAQIFVIGYSTLAAGNEEKLAKRKAFNEACRAYCLANPRFRYVDVDTLIPRQELLDQRHFSPAGYFILARHILTESGMPGPALGTRDRATAAAQEWAAQAAQ